MGTRILALIFLAPIFLSLLANPVNSAPLDSKTYIVHMEKNASHCDLAAKAAWYTHLMNGAKEILPLGHPDDGKDCVHHVYDTVFNGFSARLTQAQAAFMETMPGVLALYPNQIHTSMTTHSPAFLGLSDANSQLWSESHQGDDVIVGVIDSGIWPERLSFSDRLLGPIPKRWRGICQTGTNFTAENCNGKIIGARWFVSGLEHDPRFAPIKDGITEYKSPRDMSGHGTHCASIAAGRWSYRAGMNGFAKGTAVGTAPRARIAVYKALWKDAEVTVAATDDIVAAFDKAVADGVDVISYSATSGVVDFHVHPVAIAMYNAAKRGIFVSTAAGNFGPSLQSVVNNAPWVTTVASTTQDREIRADVVLGDGVVVHGISAFLGTRMNEVQASLIFGGDAAINTGVVANASLCQTDTLDVAKVEGKILVCNCGPGGVGIEVLAPWGLANGVVGVIHANVPEIGEFQQMVSTQGIPYVWAGNKARESIMEYIVNGTSATPMATIHAAKTVLGVSPAPVVAYSSSRGPPTAVRGKFWLKPDLAAPGVSILAAGIQKEQFVFMSGTSMACPHVSGLGALLKAEHTDWSPAAIRSALMTTATTLDNTNNTITTQDRPDSAATPFAYGAGFVQPEKAMNPGLVYDMDDGDYLTFLCALNYTQREIRKVDPEASNYDCPTPQARVEDTNLPSFLALYDATALANNVSVTFTRTLTNVGPGNSTYTASVENLPEGFDVSVMPSVLSFPVAQRTRSFTLTVTPNIGAADVVSQITHGSIVWSNGEHVIVRSPIVVLSLTS